MEGKMTLIFAGLLIFAVWFYILFVRPFLIDRFPPFGKFAAVERALFDRSRTILAARMYWIGGALLGIQQIAASAGLDATPIINEAAKMIPEQYRGLVVAVALFITGLSFEWLRKKTTTPVGVVAQGNG
jgi:hypothetical protein